jgi:Na+/H+ antiporter NhaD/arsenite permease-like protein
MLWATIVICVCALAVVGISRKRLRRWFLTFGCLGVVIAIILLSIPAGSINPRLLLLFFPTSIVAIVDPRGLFDTVLVACVEFGGNFLLYGAAGTLVALIATKRPNSELNTTKVDPISRP